ncbi:hypothetical protein QR680_004000 [Steinernema hermaphroditum]|uniref:Uncharacterized protein n=1 Tax=Steinernema hermaphroditum TaxID=289476 RepID=A0AA39HMB0_9BILA|nr:hypothetical protein QR680_004000 [Steinernema hermaphroditum]
MESVPVTFVDHLAELLGKYTLYECANSFTNVMWERTLQLHKANRWTIDLYITKKSDEWHVSLCGRHTEYTWEEARTFNRRFMRLNRCDVYSPLRRTDDAFIVSTDELRKIAECFRLNSSPSQHVVVDSDIQRIKLEGYEILLDLLAGARFSVPSIGVLNQYSHNFFSQQATSITQLILSEVDRPEDYELLAKLIAMENLERCEIRNINRKLNFIAVEACVKKWKSNEQFIFYLSSSGAYSKQEVEPLFGEADENGYYALIVEGRTSRFVGLRYGSPRKSSSLMFRLFTLNSKKALALVCLLSFAAHLGADAAALEEREVENGAKPRWYDENCPIHKNDDLHAVMDRICLTCHDMFSHEQPNLRVECRSNCFNNEKYKACLELFAPRKQNEESGSEGF